MAVTLERLIMESLRKLFSKGPSVGGALVVFALLCVAASQPAVGQSFTIQDLGDLPGGIFSEAKAVNDSGQIVGGAATYGRFQIHAFLWDNGELEDLGTLPGDITAAGISSEAYAINNHGEVVGEAATLNGFHAFLFDKEGMKDLGTLPGNLQSRATGINDGGQVVGYSYRLSPDTKRAFLWENGEMFDLGTLLGGGYSEALAINNRGQIVGDTIGSDGQLHAFLFDNGVMNDLGVLPGGTSSVATAINNRGQVVGYSSSSNGLRGFLWEDGRMIDLGTLLGDSAYSEAFGINNRGQIVGDSANHAFLWQNGVMIDLNSLPYALGGVARAINKHGEVAGSSDNLLGKLSEATLWISPLGRGHRRGYLGAQN